MKTRLDKAAKLVSSKSDEYSNLKAEDFAELFGTTTNDLGDNCKKLIAKADFRYRKLMGIERDKAILDVLKKVESDQQKVGSKERQSVWNKGWSENLRNFIKNNYKLEELIPKFVKRNEPIRLYGNYVMPASPDFETSFVTVLRTWFFKKYFRDVEQVFEFGCGTGLNLVALAKLFPEKKLYGLDWSGTSSEIVDLLAKKYSFNMQGVVFDMFSPDESLRIRENSGVFTIGAMEQLGENYEAFLQFLLRKNPAICINVEPIYELYDNSSLFDFLAVMFHKKRGYLGGYLSRLRAMESNKRIEIVKIQRTFETFFQDGYSLIIWKPKNV